MVETVSFRAFLEANWGTYGYGYLRWPGVEVTDETGKLPRYARLCYICAKFRLHHIGSPVKGSRQLCCRGVELKPINYQLLALRCGQQPLVGNGFIRSVCDGLAGSFRS